jgi:tetratricopeptide (TPR) repeat protein
MSRSTRRRAGRAAAAVAGRRAARAAPASRRAPRWLLVTVTALLPFVLLALAEGGLRLAGYGHDLEPVFIDAPGLPGYRQANPRAVLRLFTDPAQAPSVSIETAYFRADRAAGSLRIVVQGASTAAGFPYGLGASLAGVLEQRLRRDWPGREIEVISTAMAAVNSYALVDFAQEILALEPDAVVLYVGHNEYLGILGVGSTLRLAGSPRLTRAVLAVRELRLFQLLQALLPSPAGPEGAPADEDDTLMARVAGQRSIPLGSRLYRAGLEQYEHNLDTLLGTYERAGVPVFIGTVASNERDQAPFAGEEARRAFAEARRLDAGGDAAGAGEAYRRARDLDELRFRAPGEFNDVVRRVAARHHATLVESERRLRAASPDGIIGAGLMLEHVHPNLDGYFLLADAFFDALLAGGLPGRPEVVVADDEARREMPVTEVDRWLGEYKVAKIKAGWPFREPGVDAILPRPATEAERLAQALYRQQTDWPRAQEALRRHYRETGDLAAYAQVTQVLADAFPAAATLQFEAAAALIGQGRPLDALRYARASAALAPRQVNPWLVLGHAAALVGHDTEARDALKHALALEPANTTAQAALGQLERRVRAAPPPATGR